jgi:hypothetical protein
MNPSHYKYDVCVGSRQVDDDPITIKNIRWVTMTCDDLQTLLNQNDKERVRLHRLEDPIARRDRDTVLAQSATLVAVLAHRGQDPAHEYGSHFERFALPITPLSNELTRLFLAYKADCDYRPPERHPPGYHFYSPENGTAVPFLALQEKADEHIRLMYKLADDIRKTLQVMKGYEDTRPRVYLTHDGPKAADLFEQLQETLRSECQFQFGLKGDARDDKFASEVRQKLEGCRLSVHLFGGNLPRRADESVDARTLMVAKDLAATGKLAVIVWTAESAQGENYGFVGAPFERLEILCGQTPRRLKIRILEGLERPLRGEKMRIFLIAHGKDLKRVQAMTRALNQDADGYSITVSPECDEDTYDVTIYDDYLKAADAAIICYGEEQDRGWLERMKHILYSHLRKPVSLSKESCAIYFVNSRARFTSFKRVTGTSFDAEIVKNEFLFALRTQ